MRWKARSQNIFWTGLAVEVFNMWRWSKVIITSVSLGF